MKLHTEWKRTYKLKDKKVTLWKHVEGHDDMGQSVIYWKEYKKVWAYYRQSSGTEIRNAVAVDQSETAHFTVNYLEELNDTAFMLSYKGNVYNIERIDNYEGYHEELEITASWNDRYTEDDLREQAKRYESSN